jgi:uncharacterized protein
MPRVIHFDLTAKNPEKAVEFYTKVFGWEFKKWNSTMEYWLVMTGPENKPGINGGLSRGEPSKHVVLTIDVDSLDEMIKKIQANGGKITQSRGPIPGVGWYAAFRGPDGNELGLMQADPKAK